MRSAFVMAFLVACSVDHTGLQLPDAGPSVDAVGVDSPALDGGGDALLQDANTPDVNTPDVNTPDANEPDANTPDAGPPADAGCPIGERECDEDTLRVCTAMGWEETRCGLECADQPGVGDSCYDLVPSNLNRPLSDIEEQDAVIVPGGRWDTDQCDSIPNFWYVQMVPDDVDLCVLAFDDFALTEDLTVVGSRALVIASIGNVTIAGEIRADADGVTGGPGGAPGSTGESVNSPYCGGDGVTTLFAGPGGGLYTDSGGGGGGAWAEGGEGGHAGGRGGSPRSPAGARGAEYPQDYLLVPLRGGGCGGVGGTGASRGFGGGGGGAIQISARGDITIREEIFVSGGGGRGGRDGTVGDDDNAGAGGGGGAGGSVLIEAGGMFTAEGDGGVLAAGGGGGGAAGCFNSGYGEDGQAEEGGSVAGGSDSDGCGSTAGDGGAGSLRGRGTNGGDSDPTGANGGGGGGGAGLIVIRASERTGSLDGTGHREFRDPPIAAVD